jgi:hypothetical protein
MKDIPVPILAECMVPFLSELETYCATMVCKDWSTMGRHVRRPPGFTGGAYPAATFWRLKWCPVCNVPYAPRSSHKFMHDACRRRDDEHRMWSVSRDGSSIVPAPRTPISEGVYFYGTLYSGLFSTSARSAEVALGVPSRRFWGHLERALGAAQRAERHAFYKVYLPKQRVVATASPFHKVDVVRLFKGRLGNELYQLEDPMGTLREGADRITRAAPLLQEWYESTVVPDIMSTRPKKCWVAWFHDTRYNVNWDPLYKIAKGESESVILRFLSDALTNYKGVEIYKDVVVRFVMGLECACTTCAVYKRAVGIAVRGVAPTVAVRSLEYRRWFVEEVKVVEPKVFDIFTRNRARVSSAEEASFAEELMRISLEMILRNSACPTNIERLSRIVGKTPHENLNGATFETLMERFNE